MDQKVRMSAWVKSSILDFYRPMLCMSVTSASPSPVQVNISWFSLESWHHILYKQSAYRAHTRAFLYILRTCLVHTKALMYMHCTYIVHSWDCEFVVIVWRYVHSTHLHHDKRMNKAVEDGARQMDPDGKLKCVWYLFVPVITSIDLVCTLYIPSTNQVY